MTQYAAVLHYPEDNDWTAPENAPLMAEYGAFGAARGLPQPGGVVRPDRLAHGRGAVRPAPGAPAVPVLRLDRAVALGERDGPQVMLAELDVAPLERSHLWHAARAEALHRLGQRQAAANALDRALALVPGEAGRRLLERRRQSR